MLSAVPACPPNTQLAIHAFHQEPVQSNTAHAYPNNKTVAQLIAECAAAAPQAVALVAGSEQVTYGELDQQSNQLAHYLISLGVGRESIVALCLSRSISAVVWSLAILKAGGAYLPIDPAYPTERIAFVLRHMEDRSTDEIAIALGIAPNSAKQAVFRAVQKLRQSLAPLWVKS